MTIGWKEPESNGCPIQGFEIYRDTGNLDDLSINVDSSIVSNKPSLRQYQINGLTLLGATYRFKVRAINSAGYTDCIQVLNVVLSDVPDAPTKGPISDASVTNENTIKVFYGPQSASQNGGS